MRGGSPPIPPPIPTATENMELLEKIWEGTTTAVNGVLSGLDRGLTTLFGSANSRQLKRYGELAKHIGELEPRYMAMSDVELKEQTFKFRKRLADGQTIDDVEGDADIRR